MDLLHIFNKKLFALFVSSFESFPHEIQVIELYKAITILRKEGDILEIYFF